MSIINTAEKRTDVDMVNLTGADLGFTSYCTTTELFARAKELGLGQLRAEVCPHYLLQNTDQLFDDFDDTDLSFGMAPIRDSWYYWRVFTVHYYDNGPGLDVKDAGPHDNWSLGSVLAFSLPPAQPPEF